MQLQRESTPGLNTVTAYGNDYIEINEVHYEHAVYFAPEGEVHVFPAASVDDITAGMLRDIAGLGDAKADPLAFLDGAAPSKPEDAPELVLIGTGLHQHFLPVSVSQALLKVGIGVEAMTTQAAARTYNILMAEGRRVVAALLPQKET